MPTKRIPLIGSLINRDDPNAANFQDTQRFYNCFPEITTNPITGQSRGFLYKRPGLVQETDTGAGRKATYGACDWTGATPQENVFAFYDNSSPPNLKVYGSATGNIGNAVALAASTATRVRLSETLVTNGGATIAPHLVVLCTKNGNTYPSAYYLKQGDVVWTEITDADFPPNQATPITLVGNAVHMDGYMFVMDKQGRIWNSDLNSLSSWTSTSFITASTYPDGGAGLARTGDYIVAFGTKSVELFYNAGNATGSPLARVRGGSFKVGVDPYQTGFEIAVDQIKMVGDNVVFIGTEADSNTRGVYVLNKDGPKKISTPYIDKALETSLAAIAGAVSLHGQSHIVLGSIFTPPRNLAYSLTTGIWWELNAPYTIYSCMGAGGDFDIQRRAACENSSYIYKFNGTADTGANIDMMVYTEADDFGTSLKKTYSSAELVCDYQSTAGNIEISWSDDDLVSFSTPLTIDPSSGTRRVTRLGASQMTNNNKRNWKIRESVDRPFRAEALVINFDVGTS